MLDIKKNEIYTMQITGMTHEGQGVGRVNNFTVFVDDALVGEQVEVKIIKIGRNYAVGKLLRINTRSQDRAEPFCSFYQRCGGCNLQHMSYEGQLGFKTGTVREALKRIGKLENVTVHDTLGMQDAFNYRNKAQYPVGWVGEKPALGFHASRSHEIIDCSSCGIQHETSDRAKEVVREFILEHNISVYDETSGKGLVRHVVTRSGHNSGDVMVVIVINGSDLPHKQELVRMLLSQVPQIRSIQLNINMENTNVILGEKNKLLYGSETIVDSIGQFNFNISPLSFFQVNPVQTEVLYGKALEYAALTGNETVFDLYCGIGTISLFLSQKAQKVYGVEVVEAAIRDARQNARLNGVENVEFSAGEAEKVIPEMYKKGIRADVVVVDPPRKGCDEVLLKTLVDMQPQRIVYVSCNPSTLARDLNYLNGNGFEVQEVQPVDMFPWTTHVEAIILMTYCGLDKKK